MSSIVFQLSMPQTIWCLGQTAHMHFDHNNSSINHFNGSFQWINQDHITAIVPWKYLYLWSNYHQWHYYYSTSSALPTKRLTQSRVRLWPEQQKFGNVLFISPLPTSKRDSFLRHVTPILHLADHIFHITHNGKSYSTKWISSDSRIQELSN